MITASRRTVEPPLYVISDVEAFINDVVLPPINTPQLFDPVTNPLRNCVALFGRKGVQKRRAVEHLLNESGTISAGVSVDSDNIEAVPGLVTKFATDIGATVELDTPRLRGVLIIEHADVLCFEPPTKQVMEFTLDLAHIANTCKVLVLCLFDRLPPAPGDKDDWINPGHTRYYQKFFAQFTGGGYMPPPHSEYRAQLFRWYFEYYENSVAGRNAMVRFNLSDGDYVELAAASSNTTVTQMVNWIQGVIYHYAKARTQELVVDMDALSEHMNQAQGFAHICRKDMERLENKWRQRNGKGPVATPAHKQSGVHFANIKGISSSKTGGEEDKFKQNFTGFTKEAADVTEASAIIKRKKGVVSPQHQMGDAEEEEEEGGDQKKKRKKRRKKGTK